MTKLYFPRGGGGETDNSHANRCVSVSPRCKIYINKKMAGWPGWAPSAAEVNTSMTENNVTEASAVRLAKPAS